LRAGGFKKRRPARRRIDRDHPALYEQLLAVAPTPIVSLNRAVVVAEIAGP
jgi:predicted RNA polymerase sigma factor